MAEVKIDLSALENLNIPEIAFSADEETNLTDEDTQTIKNEVVDEINSLDEFVGDLPEETDETTTETTQTTETTNTEQTNEEYSPVRALAEWAGEKGLFDFDPDKFEDTEEFLENKFKETIDKGVTSYKENLPEEIHKLIDNYQEGVPLDELIYSKSREIEYKGIDEDKLSDNIELQKRLVAEWIANTDPEATNEEITKKIQKYEDSVLLEDEAKTALKKLQRFEEKYQESLVKEAKAAKIADKKRFDEQISNLEKQILSTEEFLPGIKLTKEERQKLFEVYTKTDSKGQTALMKKIAADPLANLKIAQLFGLYDGKLDTIKTKLKTTATQEIKKTVNTYSEGSKLNKININKIREGMKMVKGQ
tara:strand:+ start:54540 stop:55631 length:1092 start_codon:yes stop_codon:yes gene_type:complete